METNKINKISRIHDLEEQAYKDSIQHLSDNIILIEDIINLYDSLAKMKKILPRDKTITGETAANMIIDWYALLFNCHARFITACLAGLRGHFSDSFIATRIAIESSVCAYKIKKCPHLAYVWLKAFESNQENKEYRKEFKTKYLFPSDHPIINVLHKRYDDCSKLAHSNIHSMLGKLKLQMERGSFSLEFDYFELEGVDVDGTINWFFNIIDTHIKILQVFDEIFKEIIDYDRKKWEINLNQVKKKITILYKRWRKIVAEEKR